MATESFETFFLRATTRNPFEYQRRLVLRAPPPQLLRVPTGSGKTMAVLAYWLWQRRYQSDEIARRAVPRRLVYVLPMRSLVEQTVGTAKELLNRLDLTEEVNLHQLMGGEADDTWLQSPERDAVLVGTQDMLLSRALNRGYAQSRFAWPRAFGLLQNDALWVLDEVQLMGSGLATTAQLAGFRQSLGTEGPAWSIWMSATAERGWLRTVDHPAPGPEDVLELDGRDRLPPDQLTGPAQRLARGLHATKQLAYSGVAISGSKAADVDAYVQQLATFVREHHQPGSLTMVVLNTVDRACKLYRALQQAASRAVKTAVQSAAPDLLLLHSRFRPGDRRKMLERLLTAAQVVDGPGTIVVTTQVVEAGVDLSPRSARTLVTELAPWASLVQRLGRLNRSGEFPRAVAFWTDLPDVAAPPYEAPQLANARELLTELERQDVCPHALESLDVALPFRPSNVLRRRDLLGLFDTTADLTEVDLDISPYVRDLDDETDVQVYWREWGPADNQDAVALEDDTEETDETAEAADDVAAATPLERKEQDARWAPPHGEPEPGRDELCPVPVGELRKLVKEKKVSAFQREPVHGGWLRLTDRDLRPGLVVVLHARDGRYDLDAGWDANSKAPVRVLHTRGGKADSQRADLLSQDRNWQTLAAHTDAVVQEMHAILGRLDLPSDAVQALQRAARLHDLGKAHELWQARLRGKNKGTRPPEWEGYLMGKAPDMVLTVGRRFLRHELASALALIAKPELLDGCDDVTADLVRYLVASHHGKVRMVLRSLAGEIPPKDGPVRVQPPEADGDGVSRARTSGSYALGILDGDELPSTDLGGGVVTDVIKLSLNIMTLGTGDAGASWSERTRRLRDDPALGPFRLAYYEALLRAADTRASGRAVVTEEAPDV